MGIEQKNSQFSLRCPTPLRSSLPSWPSSSLVSHSCGSIRASRSRKMETWGSRSRNQREKGTDLGNDGERRLRGRLFLVAAEERTARSPTPLLPPPLSPQPQSRSRPPLMRAGKKKHRVLVLSESVLFLSERERERGRGEKR